MTESERITQRLAELRSELAAGEAALADLDARRQQLVTSMLRISGAVQVLEEMLGPVAVPEPPEPRSATGS
ncbi:MAG TPA: hypothetical protein VN257_07465 [Actinotalea sp.]|nr:hypothetical protein [Actinotalea sp.]